MWVCVCVFEKWINNTFIGFFTRESDAQLICVSRTMKFQLLAEHSVHFLAYYNSSCFVYWFIVCVHWLASIFVNVISINHALRRQLFIHSFTRSAHSSGAEQLVQHFRILLAIISHKHTVENDLIMKRKLTACCPCLLVFPLSLAVSLSFAHMHLAAAAVAAISVCIRVPNIRFRRSQYRSPSLSCCPCLCLWYDVICCIVSVCVCVSFMHISNRAAYCSPPSRTDIPLHWGPHRALPLYSNCCPASSLAAPPPLLYLPRVQSQSQPEPSADAAEPRQQGQLKHICIMPVCLWSGRKLIRCIDLCPTTRPELVQQQ